MYVYECIFGHPHYAHLKREEKNIYRAPQYNYVVLLIIVFFLFVAEGRYLRSSNFDFGDLIMILRGKNAYFPVLLTVATGPPSHDKGSNPVR